VDYVLTAVANTIVLYVLGRRVFRSSFIVAPYIRAGVLGAVSFFGAIAFVGVPAVAYFGKKLNCGRTEYRFFRDKLEFEEGFFTMVIEYRDVKEVTLRKGMFQRIYGLGTIYLATLATGSSGTSNPFVALGFGNVSASGVYVRDIQEPDRIFDEIRDLIHKNKE
jgi:membrane protein YdbS with pleckstrin-like domain